MYVGDGTDKLVSIDLDEDGRYHLLHLHVLFHDAVKGIRNKVHDDIQVDLVWFLTISVKELSHFNAVGMVQGLQYFELTVFVAFVLKDLLDGHCLPGLSDGCLKNDSE